MNTNDNGTKTISAAELREVLFYLENQEMTVRELRAKLFETQEQDKQVEVNFALFAKLGVR